MSERHLAQLESGEGNISVVLLQRIAAALNVPVANLFAAQAEEPTEKRLIQRFLERLPAHRLEDVVFRLMRDLNRAKGVTFVIVTHNEALSNQADRILRMVDGKIA